MERKVYSEWAFTSGSAEKSKINRDIYRELLSKYRVGKETIGVGRVVKDDVCIDKSKYDIYYRRKPGYNHSEYHVLFAPKELDHDEIALILDDGNLCFGYKYEGSNNYYVFED